MALSGGRSDAGGSVWGLSQSVVENDMVRYLSKKWRKVSDF